MRYGLVVGAWCLIGLAAPAAWAQSSQVRQLQEQIEALQEHLQSLEKGEKRNKRVAQIGGSRLPQREPELVIRTYDLSDLFALAPPYEASYASDLAQAERPLFPRVTVQQAAGGGMGGGGMGGGFGSVRDGGQQLPEAAARLLAQAGGGDAGISESARTSMEEMIDAITATISPDSWDEVGGPGSIAKLGTTLVISADRQTHDQIEALLNLLRQRWKTLRTISVRAWWLWLTDAQLAALLPAEQPADQVQAFGLVDEGAWNELMENLAQAGDEAHRGYRAAVTCYTGQTVHTVAGGQSLAVTRLSPVAVHNDQGAAGQIGYEPTVALVQEGAAFQVTPMSSTSGKFVVLDLRSRVSKLREQEPAADQPPAQRSPAPRQVVEAIDRPLLMVHHLSTTLRVPVERLMMVGGMTFQEKREAGQTELYLFVKTSVQELRDDLDQADEEQLEVIQPDPAAEDVDEEPPQGDETQQPSGQNPFHQDE